ncbi:Alternative oxidase, mitochondrial, partial [Teratosphaeriaceae sp. CCFEE 6253]
KEDLLAVEEWVKRHVETTWHSLGTCSMAPKEGNSIVKHGVLDERLNVHGVKGLKVADLSICPDNVGCNTYSTALLIGEKCSMLTAEDLGTYPAMAEYLVTTTNKYHRVLRPGSRHEGARLR